MDKGSSNQTNMEQLTPLLSAIPVCSAIVSLDKEVLTVNPLWQEEAQKHKTSGLFCDVGQLWLDTGIDPKQKIEFEQGLQKVLSGQLRIYRHRTTSYEDPYRYDLATFVSTFTSDAGQYYLVCIRINLDAQFRNQTANLVPPAAYPLLNILSEGVVVQDENGTITVNNPAAEKILGLTSDQMRGRSNTDPRWGTVNEDGKPCPPEEHPSSIAFKTGRPVYNFVMGVHLPDNSLRWLKVNSSPLFAGEKTTPHSTLTSFADITETKEKELALRAAQNRLQLTLDVAHIGVWEFDINNRVLKWDDSMFTLFEIDKEDFNHELDDWVKRLHPDDKERIQEEFKFATRNELQLNSEFRILTPSGETKFIKVTAKFERDNTGSAYEILGINTDITLEKTITQEIEANRAKLQTFIEHLPIGAFFVEDNNITLNVKAEEITGYSRQELSDIDSLFGKLFTGQEKSQLELYKNISGLEILDKSIVLRIQRKDHQQRWIDFRGCIVDQAQAWVMKDITDQVIAEEELKQLAYYDVLTQLPNRAAIEAQLQEAIYRAERNKNKLGILLIDLDLFKNVNDTYGHPVGDQLLVAVAARLNQRVRKSDIFGRLGGDEFLLIIEDAKDTDYLESIAKDLLKCSEEVFELDQNVSVSVRLSIGISIFPDHGEDSVHLFRNADTALYKAKSEGRNICKVYDQAFTVALKSRLTMEQRIENALNEEQFDMHFQPILDCSTGLIRGAEALMRWQDEELGFVTPADFIPIAEDSGLIVPLGAWAIKRVCKQVQAWRETGANLRFISINISASQFSEPGLYDLIKTTLAETDIEPDALVLEITESILMQNHASTKKALLELNSLGVNLAIDDFGTGYSSLAYLKSFSVDSLKIDRSFVKDVPGDENDVQITSAIISMAKNLNLKVVAEGVETKEQKEFVTTQGCDYFQGYLVSPALDADAFLALLNQRGAKPN